MMKTNIKISNGFIIFCLVIIATLMISCNNSRSIGAIKGATNISNAIDSNKWTFVPTRIAPQSGRSGQVNGAFFVTQLNNQLTVYLPYFGQAYGGADVLSGKSPLDFSSVNFDLSKTQVKEGEWDITIVPRDNTQVQSMNFIFYENGNAGLNVTLTNRSGIRYEGTIRQAK